MTQARRRRFASLSVLVIAALAAPAPAADRASSAALPDKIEFNRDVRPILAETCFKCHGFDKNARKADLRLDVRDEALTKREDDTIPIVPGKPLESEIYKRLVTDDKTELMPPPKAKLPLTSKQVAIIRNWIEQGAEYEAHWAYLPVKQPALPEVKDSPTGNADAAAVKERWSRSAIDRFIIAKLHAEGLTPSPRAAAETLIRRVTLDLTGLPPTPEEVDAFVKDTSPDAYAKLVSRLLGSPDFGERMAWDWLDAARYADSNGYQGDGERTMWPWRDWVVGAFNKNLPYDQFTIWQLAGDQLPNATFEQKLATGFNRNHMINGEGGRIAEENRIEYVFDQAETTGTIWLGLTFNCCRCHDHKFDPLTRKDYYSLFAYFNQTPVNGGGGDPATPPIVEVLGENDRARIAELEKQIAALDGELKKRATDMAAKNADREKAALAALEKDAWDVLAPTSAKAAHQTLVIHDDRIIFAGGTNPAKDTYTITATTTLSRITGLRLEALRHPTHTHGGLARSDSGNFVLTEIEIQLTAKPGEKPTSIKVASAEATYEQGDLKVNTAFDGNPNTGWAVWNGKPVDRDHEAVFRFAAPVDVPKGAGLTITLRHDSPHISHNIGRFRLSATGDAQPTLAPGRQSLIDALRTAPDKRDKAKSELVAKHLDISDPESKKLRDELEKVRKSLADTRKSTVKVMVMEDMPKPRKTFILDKGLYSSPLGEVAAATPASLPAQPKDAPRNRLGLAQWLVAPQNPLTARVTVNRIWAQFFGIGLVKTIEDFGVQSEAPRHAELLDWLAAEFVRTNWDVKELIKLIVTSETYMQSSKVSPELYERDPENRLLARAPRYRLPSWMIRDQALAASGLLVNKPGGPPVKPYQPTGIWEEATFGNKRYTQDKGEALYRRSLYVFWRRIVGPTMFFDVAARQVCTVKQLRTNSPLHALTTLNDITYLEAARAMAQRVIQTAGDKPEPRIDLAYRLVLSRKPSPEEASVLAAAAIRIKADFTRDADAARKLLKIGDSPRDEKIDALDHATWTVICNAVLNLDEALTKE